MNRILLTALIAGSIMAGSIQSQQTIPSTTMPAYTLARTEVPAPLRTFYINAESGDDEADGQMPETAWRTLVRANEIALPGDQFLLSGTFVGQRLRPSRSGTEAHKIVFTCADSTTALLDARGMESMVQLDSLSHIVIQGLELTGGNYIVQLWGDANQIWLRDLYIHDSGGVLMKSSSDNRVEDCRFERIGNEARNTGDAIHIRDGSHRNVFVRNTVAYAGHGAIGDGFRDSTEASCLHNVIAYNDIFNPWSSGIVISGKAHATLIEHNSVHGMADGSGSNYARSGISLTVSDCIVRYNDVYDNGAFGLTLEGRPFNGYNMDGCRNHIYHNTFWNNARGGVQLFQKANGRVADNLIENNIFWNVEPLAGDGQSNAIIAEIQHSNPHRIWADGSFNGNIFRHNILPLGEHPISFVRRGDITIMSMAEAAFDGWARNLQIDPLLSDPADGDFTLRPGSPVIDAGLPISGMPHTGSAPDLGAHETP